MKYFVKMGKNIYNTSVLIDIQAESERSAKMKASKIFENYCYNVISLYDDKGLIAYKEKYKKTGWKSVGDYLKSL